MAEKKSDIDWSILKLSIIVFCICILLVSGLVASAYYFNVTMEKEYNRNKSMFQSISRRYLDIDQEEQLLLDYYPRFVKLYNDGVLGRERRLNWIEALRQSGESVKIPSMTYSIESQAEFKPAYDVKHDGFRLYTSRMELMLGLFHEGDIFRLLNELNQKAKGLFTVNVCSFNKTGQSILFEKGKVNINSTCTLQWITINLPDGKDIEIL